MDIFDFNISPNNIALILNKNLGFKLIPDPVLKDQISLELSSEQAFSLSLVQGATYLVTSTGLSFKDRLEIFIHRGIFQNNKYIYSPGLFGRNLGGFLTPGNSPRELFSKFPSIKSGTKKLIFRSMSGQNGSNIEKQTRDEIIKAGFNSDDFLLFKFSEDLTYLEPFFEYLSCKVFDNLGYFTESQTPWFQQSYNGLTGGIPDYSIFFIKEFQELKKKNLLPSFMLLQNLSTLFAWRGNHDTIGVDYDFYIGEVKSSKKFNDAAKKQLDRYSKASLATRLYATLYDENMFDDRYGLIHLRDDFGINICHPHKELNVDSELRKQDGKWIVDYTKFYLLANLPFNQIIDFISNKTNKKEKTKLESFDLLQAIHKTNFGEIVDLIDANI